MQTDGVWLSLHLLRHIYHNSIYTSNLDNQTEIPKIISAYPNLGLSHFVISCFLEFLEQFNQISNYSLFDYIEKYMQLFKTLSFASRLIAAVSKALFLPFLQLLKMGAVRLRTWITDLSKELSKEGASKAIQFSELCCSLLAVLESALNI